jgi:hypothetical protein
VERRRPGGGFICDSLSRATIDAGFEEIVLPSVEPAALSTCAPAVAVAVLARRARA